MAIAARRGARAPRAGSASRSSAEGDDELRVDGHAGAPLRRLARGRPDRGGRAPPRPRPPAAHAAGARRAAGRADARPAPAPAGRGRDARPRVRPGDHLEPGLGRDARGPACACPPTIRAGRAVRLANPLSEDAAGAADDAARRSARRGPPQPARAAPRPSPLFESGRAYLAEPAPDDGGTSAGAFPGTLPAPDREPHRLAAIVVGPLAPPAWRGERRPGDFFALKGVARGAVPPARASSVALEPAAEPFLHPGRAAAVDGRRTTRAGWIGELHPAVAAAWDLPGGTAFEVDLAPLIAASESGRGALRGRDHAIPAVLQDLAVVVAEDVPARAGAGAVARRPAASCCARVRIFDLYRGEQVGAGPQEPGAAARVPGARTGR